MPDPEQLTDRDIREFLAEKGLTPAQSERIVGDYRTALNTAGGARQELAADPYRWLDTQAARYGYFGDPQPAISFEGAAQAVDARADQDATSFAAVREMARDAAYRRRMSMQDAFYKGARIDHGPVMDPDMLANTVANGAWTDADGNYIDPRQGGAIVEDPVPADANSIWHEIKGQRFNMGALSMPGGPTPAQLRNQSYYPHGIAYRGGAITHPSADTMARRGGVESQRVPAGVEPTRARQFVTPSQALSLLSSMGEDYLTQLQLQMWEAGLYEGLSQGDDRPIWGQADTATRSAFQALFIQASLQPNKNIAAVLADMGLNRRESSPPTPGSPGAGGSLLPDFTPTVANVESMKQDIDKIAQETLGRFMKPEERDALVGRLQEREVSLQRQQYDQQVASARMQPAGQGLPAANDVDAFLAALGAQESGGNYGAVNGVSGAAGRYQIMPANWPEWARRAGLPAGSRQTPENQEIVARQIASDYYAQFGNWRDVAVAWYSGPGNIANKRFSERNQRGGPSINDYANSVMNRMTGTRRAGIPGTPGAVAGGNIYGPVEEFDPMAEAQAAIRAADPAGWHATEWGNRATEFFGALGSALQAPR